jgi:hypothetical protein
VLRGPWIAVIRRIGGDATDTRMDVTPAQRDRLAKLIARLQPVHWPDPDLAVAQGMVRNATRVVIEHDTEGDSFIRWTITP